MGLTEQKFTVKFAGGVDTKSDSKTVQSVKLLDLVNGTFQKSSSIVKRAGYTSFAKAIQNSVSEVTDVRALGTRGDEIVLFTDGTSYSYQPSSDKWAAIGTTHSVVTTEEPAVRTGSNQTAGDHATLSGVTVYAWEDSRGGVWWSAVEASGGRILRVPAQAHATGARPRCVAVGASLHVYFVVAASNVIEVITLNPALPLAGGTPVIVTADLSATNPCYDVAPSTLTGTPGVIAWCLSTGGYRFGFMAESGVLGSPATGLPSVVAMPAAVVTVGPVLGVGATTSMVLYHDGGTTNAEIYTLSDPTIVSSITPIAEGATAIRLGACFQTSTGWHLFREFAGSTNRDNTVRIRVLSGSDLTMRGCGIAARPFVDNDRPHVIVCHDVTFFTTYLCLRFESAPAPAQTCVARTLPGVARGLPSNTHLPSVHVDTSDSRTHRWIATYREQVATDADTDVFAEDGLKLVTYDMDDAANGWQSVQLGRNLYVGGACPLRYDGDTMAEAGFHYAADEIAAPTQGTSGGLTLLGTYEYRIVYEEVDAQGETHRGPESVPLVVTMTGSNNRNTIALPTYRITSKRRVRIGVYRSEANDASALYRVTSLDPSATGSNGYVLNDPTVDTISFVDDMSDLALITKEPLYTNGDIPSNDPTGNGGVMAVGKNRVFYTDPADPLMVRYTQELEETFGADWNASLFFKVDPYGGPVTALAVMDDRVIVFKRSAVFAVTGTGPLRSPNIDASFGFAQAQLVTSDAGCTAPDSIAVTPVGLMFKSAKGIFLLGRDMSVSYVGAPVEGYNAQDVTSATLLEDRTQIVFLTSEGRSLLYDYFFQQWSTYTNHAGLGAVTSGGVYHYLRSDGRVFREAAGVYQDAGVRITLALETAWLHFQEHLQGLQRIWNLVLLGEWKSAHTLRISYMTEYMAGFTEPVNFDATAAGGSVYGEGLYGAGVYGGTAPAPYQWKVHLGERCQSIRFRFEDSEAVSVYGASFEASEISMTGGSLSQTTRPWAAGRSG